MPSDDKVPLEHMLMVMEACEKIAASGRSPVRVSFKADRTDIFVGDELVESLKIEEPK